MSKAHVPVAATSSPSGLAWDEFEQHAKGAFVENALGSRFFLKTSTRAGAMPKKTTLQVVARVTTRRKMPTELTYHTSKYRNEGVDNLARVTRLLRFAMQAILGPMKQSTVTSPHLTIPSFGHSALSSPLSAAARNADKKKKHKNKSKNSNKK